MRGCDDSPCLREGGNCTGIEKARRNISLCYYTRGCVLCPLIYTLYLTRLGGKQPFRNYYSSSEPVPGTLRLSLTRPAGPGELVAWTEGYMTSDIRIEVGGSTAPATGSSCQVRVESSRCFAGFSPTMELPSLTTVQPVNRDLWAGFGRPCLSVSTEGPFNYSSSCPIPTRGR